jgi:hypothetical protein
VQVKALVGFHGRPGLITVVDPLGNRFGYKIIVQPRPSTIM